MTSQPQVLRIVLCHNKAVPLGLKDEARREVLQLIEWPLEQVSARKVVDPGGMGQINVALNYGSTVSPL